MSAVPCKLAYRPETLDAEMSRLRSARRKSIGDLKGELLTSERPFGVFMPAVDGSGRKDRRQKSMSLTKMLGEEEQKYRRTILRAGKCSEAERDLAKR